MIRGVNRQIIEVQEMGNVYYERAYFVVRPEYDSAQRKVLEKEARKVLRTIDAPSGFKRRGSLLMRRLILCLGSAGVGALFAILLMNLTKL